MLVHVLFCGLFTVQNAVPSASQSLDTFLSWFPFLPEEQAHGTLSIIAGATSGWEDKEPAEADLTGEETGIFGPGLPEFALLCTSKLDPSQYLYNTLPEFRIPGLWIDNVVINLGIWTMEMGPTLICDLWECDGLKGCSYFTSTLPDLDAGDDLLGSVEVHLEDFRGGTERDCIFSSGSSDNAKAIFRLSCPDCASHLEGNREEAAEGASTTGSNIAPRVLEEKSQEERMFTDLVGEPISENQSPNNIGDSSAAFGGNLNDLSQEPGTGVVPEPLEEAEPPSGEFSEKLELESALLGPPVDENEIVVRGEQRVPTGNEAVLSFDKDTGELPSLRNVDMNTTASQEQDNALMDGDARQQIRESDDRPRIDPAEEKVLVDEPAENRSSLSGLDKPALGSGFFLRHKMPILIIVCIAACLSCAIAAFTLVRWGKIRVIPCLRNKTKVNLPLGGQGDLGANQNEHATSKPCVDPVCNSTDHPLSSFSQEVILATTPEEVAKLVNSDPLGRPRNVFMLQKWNPVAGLTKNVGGKPDGQQKDFDESKV